MNTDFHNSSTLRFRGKFSIDRLSRLPPHLSYVATLPCEISNIFLFQKQSLPLLIIFYSALSVAAEQSGAKPRRLGGMGDPTKACVQAPPDHGRGRAALACRGGMGPSGPGSVDNAISNGANDWQPALQPAEDILSIHTEPC